MHRIISILIVKCLFACCHLLASMRHYSVCNGLFPVGQPVQSKIWSTCSPDFQTPLVFLVMIVDGGAEFFLLKSDIHKCKNLVVKLKKNFFTLGELSPLYPSPQHFTLTCGFRLHIYQPFCWFCFCQKIFWLCYCLFLVPFVLAISCERYLVCFCQLALQFLHETGPVCFGMVYLSGVHR